MGIRQQDRHSKVIIIGAGAAGLMCAAEAAKRHDTVHILEHTAHIGEKIRISGGGRCNFTNLHASPQHYLSSNPHFVKSALTRYTPQDFIRLVEKHGISYHEKTLGQLFCDGSSKQIIAMLEKECRERNVHISTQCKVQSVKKDSCFTLETSLGTFTSDALVIASGGLSIPKLGASGFGYEIARQFGLNIIEPTPALVPLRLAGDFCTGLSGVSVETIVSNSRASFRESSLFTHKGLSGPAILQISSYWREGEAIEINLLPEIPFVELCKKAGGKVLLPSLLGRYLSKRLANLWCEAMCEGKSEKPLAEMKAKDIEQIAYQLQHWKVTPIGTEGFEKAEVTRGGVDTEELSSKTMEAKKVPGLFFIGEVVDVTGWLGGYNFQWAWSSAVAAGMHIL